MNVPMQAAEWFIFLNAPSHSFAAHRNHISFTCHELAKFYQFWGDIKIGVVWRDMQVEDSLSGSSVLLHIFNHPFKLIHDPRGQFQGLLAAL
jgi:hypothetical protein